MNLSKELLPLSKNLSSSWGRLLVTLVMDFEQSEPYAYKYDEIMEAMDKIKEKTFSPYQLKVFQDMFDLINAAERDFFKHMKKTEV